MKGFKVHITTHIFSYAILILICYQAIHSIKGDQENFIFINHTVGWNTMINALDVLYLKIGFWILSILGYGILYFLKIRTHFIATVLYLILTIGLFLVVDTRLELGSKLEFNLYLGLTLVLFTNLIWSWKNRGLPKV